MSLLKVTGPAARGPGFVAGDPGSGVRWQAMRTQSPTPNPNKASLVGSWVLEVDLSFNTLVAGLTG